MVERYGPALDWDDRGYCHPIAKLEDDGGYVQHSDYAALEARCEKAEREAERLRKALMPFIEDVALNGCDECGADERLCSADCPVAKARAALEGGEEGA